MNTSTSKTDRLISSYLKARNQQLGLTQADYMAALDRSQGYVSERLDCKRSWAISELDTIAPLVGLPDALALIAAAMSPLRSS